MVNGKREKMKNGTVMLKYDLDKWTKKYKKVWYEIFFLNISTINHFPDYKGCAIFVIHFTDVIKNGKLMFSYDLVQSIWSLTNKKR
jgi:hypothetical protein